MDEDLEDEQSLRRGENEARSVGKRSDAGWKSVGCLNVTYDASWSKATQVVVIGL